MEQQQNLNNEKGSVLVVALMIFTVLLILSTVVMTTVATGVKLRTAEKNQVEALYGAESGITLAQATVERTFVSATQFAQATATSQADFESKLETFIGTNETNLFVQAATNFTYFGRDKKPVAIATTNRPEMSVSEVKFEANEWQFSVQSAYSDDAQIERKVQADFSITIPEWIGTEFSTPDSLLLQQNLLTADGNFINNAGSLVLNGNVHIKGVEPTPLEAGTIDLESKYSGGIYNASGNTDFNGNVSTSRSFTNQGGATINGTLYAQNVTLEAPEYSWKPSKFIAKDIVVDNDLLVNSSDSDTTAQIKNFYGINDKNIATINQQRSSSSIIVNKRDSEASVNITDKAYIAGTAFIDLSQPYQTGESVAVSGNYLVYTLPISDIQAVCQNSDVTTEIGTCEQFVYDYLEPLQILTGTKATPQAELVAWSVEQKATYFKAIADNLANITLQLELQHGNVKLPENTFAAGAVVQQKTDGGVEVRVPTFNEIAYDILKTQQQAYANNVYRMGLEVTTNLQTLYDHANPTQWTVSNFVNFNAGSDVEKSNLVYNKDQTKTVVVTSKLNKPLENEVCIESESIPKKCVELNQEQELVIITAGDLIFRDLPSVQMSLSTLVGGNITMEATVGSADLHHLTGEKLMEILEEHAEPLTGVFRTPSEVVVPEAVTISDEAFSYYDPKVYVNVNNWQLLY